MSVLIRGMEMPQSCSNCNWSRYSFPNAWCSMTHHDVDIEVAKNGRPDGCPLVPVPPHGRLGDMDAIARKIRRFGDYVEFTKDEIAGWFENGDFETIIPTDPAEEGE